jgi:ankyrin repeat protein
MDWEKFFKDTTDLETIKKHVTRKNVHEYISYGNIRESLLGVAICAGNKEGVRWLLKLGADPNKPCLFYVNGRKVSPSRWAPPLHYACVQRPGVVSNTIVAILLDYGANKYTKNAEGETAYDTVKQLKNEFLMIMLC